MSDQSHTQQAIGTAMEVGFMMARNACKPAEVIITDDDTGRSTMVIVALVSAEVPSGSSDHRAVFFHDSSGKFGSPNFTVVKHSVREVVNSSLEYLESRFCGCRSVSVKSGLQSYRLDIKV